MEVECARLVVFWDEDILHFAVAFLLIFEPLRQSSAAFFVVVWGDLLGVKSES
jgi:hypothetical protein